MTDNSISQKAVLGCIMGEGAKAMAICIAAGLDKTFFTGTERKVWDLCIAEFSKGKDIDHLKIMDQAAEKFGVTVNVTSKYLCDIQDGVQYFCLPEYIDMLCKEHLMESAKNLAESMLEKIASATKDDIRDVVVQVQSEWAKVNSLTRGDDRSIYEVAKDVVADWQAPLVPKNCCVWPVPNMVRDMSTITDEYIIVGARQSVGKCLGLGTPVMMFDCSVKNVEDVKQGDVLMGPDSNPRRVLSVTTGRSKMYQVSQRYGIDFTCNGDHLLAFETSKSRIPKGESSRKIMTAKDFCESNTTTKTRWKGYKSDAIHLPWRKTPIDPYWIGMWVGNGTSSGTGITTAEPEVSEYLKRFAEHLPEIFLKNSVGQRRRLLAGLIDSDGYCARPGTLEFCSTSEQISSSVLWLCRSLGLRANIREKTARIKSIGYEVHAFIVNISGDLTDVPCLVKRKKTGSLRRIGVDPKRYVIKVDRIGEGEYYGFTLDGDGLFLLGDFTVTHNTALALQTCIVNGLNGVRTSLSSMESKKSKIAMRMISYLAKINSLRMKKRQGMQGDMQKAVDAVEVIGTLPFDVVDVGMGVEQIRAWATAEKAKGSRMCVIDNFKHIRPTRKYSSPVEQFRDISIQLKWVRDDVGIPIMVLHHLNKGGDLSWSDDIWRDADIVILMTDKDDDKTSSEDQRIVGKSIYNEVDLLVAKDREGNKNLKFALEFNTQEQTFFQREK